MTQHHHYEEGAGPWVVYVLRKGRPTYPWAGTLPWQGWSWTSTAKDSVRFNSRREAEQAMRDAGFRGPHAHRVGEVAQ